MKNFDESRNELKKLAKKARKLYIKQRKIQNKINEIYEEYFPNSCREFDECLSYTYAKRDAKSTYKWTESMKERALDWIDWCEERGNKED